MTPNDVHQIIVLAERIAVKRIKAELRAKGGKITLAPGPTLKAQAMALLRLRPEIYAEAKENWRRMNGTPQGAKALVSL